MKEINPENKCASLYQEVNVEKPIHLMFGKQQELQARIGKDPSKMSFEERIQFIKDNWTYMTTEYAELLERLPYKHWKKYSPEQRAGWINDDQFIETAYELIDMWHFFMNIALCLGITPDMFVNLYFTKNKENFARQDRNY